MPITMLYGAGWLGGMIEKVGGSLPLEETVRKPLTTITGLFSLVMPADALQRKMLAVLFSLEDLSGIAQLSNGPFGLLALNQVPSTSFVVYAIMFTGATFFWGDGSFFS